MRNTVIISSAILLAACGTTSRSVYTEPVQQTPTAKEKVILYPRSEPLPPAYAEKPKSPRTTPETERQQGAVPFFSGNDTRIIGNPGTKKNMTVALGDDWGAFCYPQQGNKISDYGQRSGKMHSGVDIKAMPMDTIRAVGDGVVRISKEYYGYGNMVLVAHANGLETLYGHNTRNLVQPNDRVRAGQAIALAGRTGRATTEHLHFEVRVCGEYFDPNLLLDCDRRAIRQGDLIIAWSGGKPVAKNTKSGSSAIYAQSTEPIKPAQTATTSSTASSHTVEKGDTLYSISRRYGLTVDQLCALNGLDVSVPISIGQQIKVKQ